MENIKVNYKLNLFFITIYCICQQKLTIYCAFVKDLRNFWLFVSDMIWLFNNLQISKIKLFNRV